MGRGELNRRPSLDQQGNQNVFRDLDDLSLYTTEANFGHLDPQGLSDFPTDGFVLATIISGGRGGVESGALRAAREHGLTTDETAGGTDQIEQRVRDSSATLRIARDFNTPDLQTVVAAVRRFGRPCLDIHVDNLPSPADVARWLHDHQVRVLNVTGNPEHTAPRIGELTERFLLRVLGLMG
jgi:hypothetical protein